MAASASAIKFGNWQGFLDISLTNLEDTHKLQGFAKLHDIGEITQWVLSSDLFKKATWIEDYFGATKKYKKQHKCAKEAHGYRERGNLKFKGRLYKEALALYTKCIFYAPCNDAEIALGYANRSAVLFHLRKYQECETDIIHAIHHGYPEHLQYKLYIRRAQARFYQHKLELSEQDLSIASSKLNAAELDPKKLALHTKDIKEWGENVAAGKTMPQKKSCPQEDPAVSYSTNNVIVQATDAVEMKCDKMRGRFLEARQPLLAGDTLIVEKPYAAVLLPSHYQTHCHHCFTKLPDNPIPCQQCADVQYCSLVCRSDSWRRYHSVECPYLELCHSIGIAHLSMRIILTAGLDFLMEFQRQIKTSPPNDFPGNSIEGLDENGEYSCNYLTVYSLMPHIEDMMPEDLVQYTMTAALLLRCLEDGGFFDSGRKAHSNHSQDGSGPPEDINCDKDCDIETKTATSVAEMTNLNLADNSTTVSTDCGNAISGHHSDPGSVPQTKLYIGGLLLRHICQLVCNAHAITELQVTQADDASLVDTKSQVRVATAIYPTASLMNHSCDPTIISSFNKDTLVVRAVKDVKTGEEIFNCYGPHCKRMSRQDRQQCLREQYFFDCKCCACAEGQDKEDMIKACKCGKCQGPLSNPNPLMTCLTCGHVTDGVHQMRATLDAHAFFMQGMELLQKKNASDAADLLERCYELRAEVQYCYNRELAEVCDALAQCYAIIGDFSRAAVYLSKTLPITEYSYGPTSIEMANELQKMAEVQFHANLRTEAMASAERAEKLFTLNYGDQHKCVQEIQELRRFISS